MGTVKFALLSWFSIVRHVWRQQFSVLSQKTNDISVVSSHFHLYLRISALRLPTVNHVPYQSIYVITYPCPYSHLPITINFKSQILLKLCSRVYQWYCCAMHNISKWLDHWISVISVKWMIKLLVSIKRSFKLAHWGQVTFICFDNLTRIGSDNGLSPGRRKAII